MLRLLHPQGLAGIVAVLVLGLLLGLSKAETRHWRKSADRFEQRLRTETAARASEQASVRAAAAEAARADAANAARVASLQQQVNDRSQDDYERRIAAARTVAAAAAARMRQGAAAAAPADGGAGAGLPGLSASARGVAPGAGEDGLPVPDALIATEQAIQLDELIHWVRRQHAIEPSR